MIRYMPLLAQFYRPENEGRLTRDELGGQSLNSGIVPFLTLTHFEGVTKGRRVLLKDTL